MINQITAPRDIHLPTVDKISRCDCVFNIHLFRFKCDECQSFIVGTRFHCNECDDFDLCIGCHSFGKFPER